MARLGRAQAFGPLQFGAIAAAANELAATGSLSITGAAALNAPGALLAAGSLSITGAADLDASGSLAAAGALSITGAADLDALGELLAAGSVTIAGAADLDAIGNLLAAGALSISGVADISGTANDIVASGSLSITGAAALSAIGELAAAGSIVITGSATLGPEIEPEAAQKPAGQKRKRRRRRLVVEIDGRDFEVESVEQAVALLERAKEVAVKQIAAVRAAPVRVERGAPIKRPSIRTDSEPLRELVREKRAQIVDLYNELLRDLEIQHLLAQAEEEDEEETLIRFLM